MQRETMGGCLLSTGKHGAGPDAEGAAQERPPPALGPSEAEAFWTDFLRSPVKRGLSGVELVASEAQGPKGAIRRVPKAPPSSLPRSPDPECLGRCAAGSADHGGGALCARLPAARSGHGARAAPQHPAEQLHNRRPKLKRHSEQTHDDARLSRLPDSASNEFTLD